MKNKFSFFLIVLILLSLPLNAGSKSEGFCSLSDVFRLGAALKDSDEDGLADTINLQIIIPANPSPALIAAASDIAARTNLESLAVDFSLVRTEPQLLPGSTHNILLFLSGPDISWVYKWTGDKQPVLPSLSAHQGWVAVFPFQKQKAIVCAAGSDETLLQTGRAFFLRWPYLWEIWGQEEGITYTTVEKDLARFLDGQGVPGSTIVTSSAFYEFPPLRSPHEAVKRLKFNRGEINELTLKIQFGSRTQKEKAFEAFLKLRTQHERGLNTDVLSYPGCARIVLELLAASESVRVTLPRVGYPKRILTPAYKSRTKPKIADKNFDLTTLFSEKGFYSDTNKDRILDSLDSTIILPKRTAPSSTALLASRLMLHSAGASFPLVAIDKDVEEEKSLVAPILIGTQNLLNKKLIQSGKLKIPELKNGWGMAAIVPEAFNKSSAIALVGGDEKGLEDITAYISLTFPHLEEFRAGTPRIENIPEALEEFFQGKHGSAEAYFWQDLNKYVRNIQDKDFESFAVELILPKKNPEFEHYLKNYLTNTLSTESLSLQGHAMEDSRILFEKEKHFPWEGEDALLSVQEELKILKDSSEPVKVRVGVSESPKVREDIKRRIEDLLSENKIASFNVEVLSSYKPGLFWILEKIIPELQNVRAHRLVIRFAEEKDDFEEPKRFYTEPERWLQELYPVDELIAKKTDISLDQISFEQKESALPVYEVQAYDREETLLFQENFSPPTRKAAYLTVLPEWGNVTLTTGWVKILKGKELVLDRLIESDLERFWNFYQNDILPEVYSHILKKTGDEPSFSKQPYFKQLFIELWLSEPDFLLGLDEEQVSSLEAIHDEIYFDTLDFLRGITAVELEEEEALEDTSRYSAPGNVLPLIHPSLEGKSGNVLIRYEDWQAREPQMVLKWKEKGRKEREKKFVFPAFKAQSLRLPALIYNGKNRKIENLFAEVKIENEAEYLKLTEILDSYKEIENKGALPAGQFSFPNLRAITLQVKHKELVKEASLTVTEQTAPIPQAFLKKNPEGPIVPSNEIISPEMCLDIVHQLSSSKTIQAYVAGKSYENRPIPVLEASLPQGKYVCRSRLITFKPTLYLSGRQHANEISSTNYILKLAEYLAKEERYQKYLKKMNIVLHPMENPDGAELAFNLQKITPLHSLHAGRYSALGIDVGYQVQTSKPLLPEAKVRKTIDLTWLPDIYLNLHGYPSHEWVQPFSNYSPYLFRDYWIPRGWFAYYRSLTLPVYREWKDAGSELKAFIVKELSANEKIRASNKRFYDRYFRWAVRWQPHMNELELYDGVNLYAKRRSSTENKLTLRSQTTYIEETPELMDETAHGEWLDFLCEQGLSYLKAHLDYLAQVEFVTARIEEESQEKIRIEFVRRRPGKTK